MWLFDLVVRLEMNCQGGTQPRSRRATRGDGELGPIRNNSTLVIESSILTEAGLKLGLGRQPEMGGLRSSETNHTIHQLLYINYTYH